MNVIIRCQFEGNLDTNIILQGSVCKKPDILIRHDRNKLEEISEYMRNFGETHLNWNTYDIIYISSVFEILKDNPFEFVVRESLVLDDEMFQVFAVIRYYFLKLKTKYNSKRIHDQNYLEKDLILINMNNIDELISKIFEDEVKNRRKVKNEYLLLINDIIGYISMYPNINLINFIVNLNKLDYSHFQFRRVLDNFRYPPVIENSQEFQNDPEPFRKMAVKMCAKVTPLTKYIDLWKILQIAFNDRYLNELNVNELLKYYCSQEFMNNFEWVNSDDCYLTYLNNKKNPKPNFKFKSYYEI